MKKEEMIKELDETLGKANVKLVNICGDKRNIEDVVLTVEHGSDAEIVRMQGRGVLKKRENGGRSDAVVCVARVGFDSCL